MLHLAFFMSRTKYGYCLGVGWVLLNTERAKYGNSAICTGGASCQVKVVEGMT
jgi:hypothetical protein